MKRKSARTIHPALWMAGLLVMAGPLPAAPVVENLAPGEVVRHSVVLLRGTVEDGARKLEIRSERGETGPAESTGLVDSGRFKALVELTPGENVLELKTEQSELPLRLTITFRPMTNPHYVRLIWLTDQAGNTEYAVPEEGFPQTYRERLATAALLMQCFTAERMHELGYGRRTFRLETDPAGRPLVHLVKAPREADHYYGIEDTRMWGEIGRFLHDRMPDQHAKNMVLMAYTRKDPSTGRMLGHTALGGGNLGLFGSASVFSWPESIAGAQAAFSDSRKVDSSRVHDDSAGRGLYWAVASTTIGAALHEMGHTFGLPHCQDARCIMTRGFDRFNRFFTFSDPWPDRQPDAFAPDQEAWFAPVSASYLRWSPWFHPDPISAGNDAKPELQWDAEKKEIRIESRAGLRWLGFHEGGEITGFQEFKDPAPRKLALPLPEIISANGGKAPTQVIALDETGQTSRLNLQP